MSDEISEFEWTSSRPMVPTRGVRRANDGRVLIGTFLSSGAAID
jgi:hypothetical protein